jgi:hypothetical protein
MAIWVHRIINLRRYVHPCRETQWCRRLTEEYLLRIDGVMKQSTICVEIWIAGPPWLNLSDINADSS